MKKIFVCIALISVGGIYQCKTVKESHGSYTVESKDYQSTIVLYADSTFTEKRKSKTNSGVFYGYWQFINKADSIIETTIEGSGMQIYTLTPKTTYKIHDNTMIVITE